ncbi:MFS transporter [Gordonia sp. HY002]|uniref:MFS transporter n=1 Tax=Gordonia zhenghanii TaxID=2911516 RepID=UPI001EF01A25|nr:MFS transporter [Gordonia zhenghanii]MCF8571897.1 MFS transporter [Gordonia zhenghanii]MCF8605919.1 MFS transporter [Gordonia zhenghanii]
MAVVDRVGLLDPLKVRRFRAMLPVELGVSVGVWMVVLAAQWILTRGGYSASVVASVQVAVSLPFFLLGLPIGAVADVAGHRRLLTGAAVVLAADAAVAAFLVSVGLDGLAPIMASVLVAGSTLAVLGVVWQALLPNLVERRLMTVVPAVDGAVFNGARAVGPILGGAVLAAWGGVTMFTVVAVIAAACAVQAWLRVPSDAGRSAAPDLWTRHVGTALRFIRYSSWTSRLLVLVAMFGIPSSALWALLPVVADERLHASTFEFGAVSGAVGVGAVLGTVALMPLRRRLSWNQFVSFGAAAYAVALVGMATSVNTMVAALFMVVGGTAWVAVQSTWMVAAHHALPAWVRGQVLGIMIIVVQAVQAVGAQTWGLLADAVGVQSAVMASAAVMFGAAVVSLMVRLRGGDEMVPTVAGGSHDAVDEDSDVGSTPPIRRRGTILVETTYRVAGDDIDEFLAEWPAQRRSRLRLGARRCAMWRGHDDPLLFVEISEYGSLRDYAAQRAERLTEPESRLRAAMDRCLVGDAVVRVLER